MRYTTTMFLLCLTAVAFASPDVSQAKTKATMKDAFEALVRLQGLTGKPELMRNPERASSIGADLQKLTSLSHAFPNDKNTQEPATIALAGLFGRYAAETQRRFEAHETDSVGPRVRTLMALCFACHSRERASDFSDALKRIDALPVSGLERASLLAATRQFEPALVEYQKILDGPVTDFPEYSRALLDAMTVLIRVKDDAGATAKLLERVAARTDLPLFFTNNVPVWSRDVATWNKEHFNAQNAKAEALFSRGKELVKKASVSNGEGHGRKDVLWLRASAYFNLALAKNPRLKSRGEALFLLGQCAGALRSPLWWDIDELFFEACIRENGNTPVARRCFEELSQRVTLGFSGSQGTFIPDDELERLDALRSIAFPHPK
jgi:hypothetical protein